MSLSAVKYQDGIEISFSPQCKHFHLLQASEGRGSHICDRSIGPNALGRSNQSPRHAIVGAERRPDPRLFPPPLSQLVPDPPVSVRGPRKKQEPHVSTTTHPAIHPSIHPARQPGRHTEPYLTTADHQLLTRWNVMRFCCEHTKNTRLFPCCHVALKCLHCAEEGHFWTGCFLSLCFEENESDSVLRKNNKTRMFMKIFLWTVEQICTRMTHTTTIQTPWHNFTLTYNNSECKTLLSDCVWTRARRNESHSRKSRDGHD